MESKTTLDPLTEKELGNKAYKANDFSTAHAHYDKAIELDPSNIVFYTNKSAVFFQEKRFDECIQLCEKAVDIGRENSASPTSIAKPLARIGRVHLNRGEYAKAVEQFKNSISEHNVDSVSKDLQKCEEILDKLNEYGEEACVQVRDSPVHGKGVFATRDIKASELVCYYDGELITKAQIAGNYNAYKGNKQYWMSHPSIPDTILNGYRVPQNEFGVGQIINDAKMPDMKELDFKQGIKDCEDYTLESKRLMNVSFMGDGKPFQIFAIRDIKEGEELFLHYGYKMWLQEYSEALEGEKYMWRLLFWAIDGEGHCATEDGGLIPFKLGEVYDLGEAKSKAFIEMYLRMSTELIEKCKQDIPEFSYEALLANLMSMIHVEPIETSILDQD